MHQRTSWTFEANLNTLICTLLFSSKRSATRYATVEITFAVLLDLELFRSIDSDFRLSLMHLDPTSDFDVLSFDAGQHGRFRNR
jgi:hypothetical protein